MLKVNRIENADKILPTVFIKKISKEYLRFSVSDDIIEIINRTLYSKSEIESHDFLTLQNTYIEIEDKVRQQRGKIKFFFLKSSVSKQF